MKMNALIHESLELKRKKIKLSGSETWLRLITKGHDSTEIPIVRLKVGSVKAMRWESSIKETAAISSH